MACTTDFIDFVCSQLNGVGIIRSKKMFGDWLIYIDEKPVILACDNICYVKKLSVIAEDGIICGNWSPWKKALQTEYFASETKQLDLKQQWTKFSEMKSLNKVPAATKLCHEATQW